MVIGNLFNSDNINSFLHLLYEYSSIHGILINYLQSYDTHFHQNSPYKYTTIIHSMNLL